jgi:hypothetical protein
MTTPENNADFNHICKWLPLIKGAHPHPVMEPFMPNAEGFWSGFPFAFEWGGRATMVYEQGLWEFVEHKIDFDALVQRLRENMPRAMATDLERRVNRGREHLLSLNVPISWHLGTALFAEYPEESPGDTPAAVSRGQHKLKYLWESRATSYSDSYWLWRWQQHLDARQPRALAIQQHVTTDLGMR